jgi:hypothetical protein
LADSPDWHRRGRAALAEAISWPGLKRRQFKYEYTAIEIALISKFRDSLSSSISPSLVEINGFVSRVGGTGFVLRPRLAVDYGIMCEMEDPRRLPTDFQFGRAKGYRIRTKANLREASRWRLRVSDFEQIRLPTDHLKPELTSAEAGSIILGGYPDPPQQLTRNLVYSLTSSPGDSTRVGRLTATLFPLQKFAANSHNLLQDIQKGTPTDLTSDNFVAVSIPGVGRFQISPFPWNIRSIWSAEVSIGNTPTKRTAFIETTTGISASTVPADSRRGLDESH